MTQAFRLQPRGYLREEASISIGVLDDLELQSSYQVIISPALRRSVGMEAQLLVQRAGAPETQASVVARLPENDIADLDRLALAVHTRNAPAMPYGNEWLFLPIHPQTIRQRLFAPEKVLSELAALNVSPERIVLEITESATLRDDELENFVSIYRECGFRIAIDDFGAGASNYDRILSLRPNIVRLDPTLIQNAEHSPRAARLFPHMVSLLRESGSLVLVDGIMSETQARIAVDADAELLQGDWFAAFAKSLPTIASIQEKSTLLMSAGKLMPDRTELRMRSRFMAVWNGYRDGLEQEEIVSAIPDTEITRIYVIDNNGFQIGDTALTTHAMRGQGHPLSDARGACWARRQYFRNAVEQPGRVQITRPYLSLTEQRLCVTLSCVVMRPGLGQVVLCMDALISH